MNMFHHVVAMDRFQIAAMALATAEAAFELTLEYARRRKLFGKRLVDFQNTQFKLAEMETELAVGRGYMNSMVQKFQAGEFRNEDAAMAKIWLPEMEARVIDGCVQLWGGQGFMKDNLISRMYQSARVERLHAGTTEIQKDFIARRYLTVAGDSL
jgi:alkylation response protein AidB-like acyl-CoA dehydrogenase